MAATPALLLISGSVLTFPIGGTLVDSRPVPVDGLLKLADLGGVGAELVLAGGVLGGVLTPVDLGGVLGGDGDLVPLLPADLGGDILKALARFSSSLGSRPNSAAVFSTAPHTCVHRRRKIPRVCPPSLVDMNSAVSLN